MSNKMSGRYGRIRLTIAAVLTGLSAVWPCQTQSAPVSASQAEAIVNAWLAADSNPMNAGMSPSVGEVMAYPGLDGSNAFYVVAMKPTGYVVVAADDLAGSVVAFSATGGFDASPRSSLYGMLRVDLAQRLADAKRAQAQAKPLPVGKAPQPQSVRALAAPVGPAAGPVALKVIHPNPFETIARVRVPPLLASHWGETTVRGEPCYNYYTPSNCPAGAAAICLAQIIYKHRQELPGGIGLQYCLAYVNEEPAWLRTRGGDEVGGPYKWDLMVDDPANTLNLSLTNRQAIGALCSDVGITLSSANYSFLHNITRDTIWDDLSNRLITYYGFGDGGHIGWYSRADPILGGGEVDNPGTTPDLNMINANLDAGFPVMLTFFYDDEVEPYLRHISAPVDCDGYGYSWDPDTTGWDWMFHHLNLGNDGNGDIWYTLPKYIGNFTNMLTVTYNMMPSGRNGEIVSGRVTDDNFSSPFQTGFAMPGVTMVISNHLTHVCQTTVTGPRGIYAFVVAPNTDYTVYVQPPIGSPSVPESRVISVHESIDGVACGNIWAVNFQVPSYLIAGQVTNAVSGTALASLPVAFVSDGGAVTNLVTTDEGGFFAVSLPANWSGSITPSWNGGTFAPPSFYTNGLSNDKTNVNFAWLAPTMVAISGTVFRADQTSLNVADVLLSFSNQTVMVFSNVTYAQGVYVVSNLVTFSNGALVSVATLTYSNAVLLASPPVLYDACGNVTNDNGVTFSSANIQAVLVSALTNFTSAGTANSDANGNYIAYVPIHWFGTVTASYTPPYSSKSCGVFYPSGRTYANLTNDIGFQYYYWLPPASTRISGTILRRDTGDGVPNVTLFTSDGQTILTDQNGAYFFDVPYLWNGTILPFSPRGGVFLPERRTYALVQTDIFGENFFWTPPSPQLTGQIVMNDGSGRGVPGMTVTLSDHAYTATTGVDGVYTVILPNMGWSGWLIPSGPPGNQFVLPSNHVSQVITDMVMPVITNIPPCLISGSITLNGTTLRPVVSITLDGAVGATPYGITVTTVDDGSYSAPVPNGWTGSVTSLTTPFAGTFTPVPYDYSSLPITTSLPNQNYTWTPVPLLISGTVRDMSGNPKPTVTLTRCLPNGTFVERIVTDANGVYAFTNLPFGWSGLVIATAPNGTIYTLSNTTNSYAYADLTFNQSVQDFTWVQSTVTIAGTFLRDDGVPLPVAGAAIRFIGGVNGVPYTSPSSWPADADGNYTAQVPLGWTGITAVSHADAGGVFRPASRSYPSPVISSASFQNYYWMPPQNLSVSGTVRYRDNGSNAPGVTVMGNGLTVVTGPDGQYSIPVPYLWSGSISVSSLRGGVFRPDAIAVPEAHASVSDADFFWTPSTPQVSGRIVNADNRAGVAGVVVTFWDGFSERMYAGTTDVTGAYAVTLPYKLWSGSITPSFIPGGVFSPPVSNVNLVVFDAVLSDWSWTPPKTVSGRVARRDTYGPVAGASLGFVSDNASFTNIVTTDSNGMYSITLPRAAGGTTTPSHLPGGIFDPTQRVYAAAETNDCINQDYLWTPPGLTISGIVVDNNSVPLAGAWLTLVNAPNASPAISNTPWTVASGAGGAYSFTVPSGWSGSVTPSYSNGNFFLPPVIRYEAVTNDQTSQNFQWFPSSYVAISGSVVRADDVSLPVTGAAVVFIGTVGGGSSIAIAYSDAAGDYIVYVPHGWSGFTILSHPDVGTFMPSSKIYTGVMVPGRPEIYYWLPPQDLVISGRIVVRDTGLPVSGVSLDTADGLHALTDSNGVYSLSVSYLWTGIITATHPRGGVFNPVAWGILPVHRTVSDVNFSWLRPLPTVSGFVTRTDDPYGPVEGVMIAFSGGIGRTMSTADGSYRMVVPFEWTGTATPSHPAGGAFEPQVLDINTYSNEVILQDFRWEAPRQTIAGRVTRVNGRPAAGVNVTFINKRFFISDPISLWNNPFMPRINSGADFSILTDSNGLYSLDVPYGWSGASVPSHPLGGGFAPIRYVAFNHILSYVGYVFNAYDQSTAGQSSYNFTWNPPLPVVKGHVVRGVAPYDPVPDVTITFSGGAGYTKTTADGEYTWSLPNNWSGTATPSHVAGGVFSPTNMPEVDMSTNDVFVQDYRWFPSPLTVSGRVTRSDNGAPVAGVTVSFSNALNASADTPKIVEPATAITDTNGMYGLRVPFGWSGTATPAHPFGGTFLPVNHEYDSLDSSLTAENFSWSPPPPYIVGRVVRFDTGVGIAGVSLVISNDEALVSAGATNPLAVVVTDSNGIYQVSLGYSWSGSVTPVFTQLMGGVFTPAQRVYSNLMSEVTDTNLTQFTFLPPPALLVTIPDPDYRGTITGATSGWYTVGASLCITASPYADSRFVKWLEDGSTNAVRTVVLQPGTNTYTAVLVELGPVITFSGLDPSGGLDFGRVMVGKSVTRTFVVKNTGTLPCDLVPAKLPTSFMVSPSYYVTLNPGATSVVTMSFSPIAATTFTGAVTWATYPEPYSGAPKFMVKGIGLDLKDVLFYSGSLDFGTMLVGQKATRTLLLLNDGPIPLTISAKWENGTDFSVKGFPVSIPAGGAKPITVSFAPRTIKDYGGAMLKLSAAGIPTLGIITFISPNVTVAADVGGTWTAKINKQNYTLYLSQSNLFVDGIMVCKQNLGMTNQYVAGISIGALTGALYRASDNVGSLALTASKSALAGTITCAGIGNNLTVKWSRSSKRVPSAVSFLKRPALMAKPSAADGEATPASVSLVVPAVPSAVVGSLPSGTLRLSLLDLTPVELLPDDAELLVVVLQEGKPVAVSPALDRYHLSWLLQTCIETEGVDANTNGLPDVLESALGVPLQDGMTLLIVRKQNGMAVPEAPYSGTTVEGAAKPLGALPATWSLKPAQP